MPTARIDGLDFQYERLGKGAPLLFISGTGGDLRVRPGILDTPLARHFEVIAYDQRGLGRSAKPDGPYQMVDYVRDALGLLDALDLPKVRVVGVSFGGMVAQEVALLAAERIERLVLCCTSAGGAGGASYPLHELTHLPVEERFVTQLLLSDSRHDGAWQMANAALVERLRAQVADVAALGAEDPRKLEGAALQLAARAQHNTFDRLSRIELRTLLCAGRYDGIAPLSNMECMLRVMRNAELKVYEGGHPFMIQDRRAYADIIDWLLQ